MITMTQVPKLTASADRRIGNTPINVVDSVTAQFRERFDCGSVFYLIFKNRGNFALDVGKCYFEQDLHYILNVKL